jgi:hypothetical protein
VKTLKDAMLVPAERMRSRKVLTKLGAERPAGAWGKGRYEAKRGAFVQNLLQVDCESMEDAMLVSAEGMRIGR